MMQEIDVWGLQTLFGSDSAILDSAALTMTNATTWVPLYVMLVYLLIKNGSNMQQIVLMMSFAIMSVAVSSIIANVIVKPMVARPRPCNTPEFMYLQQIAGCLRSKDFSFFSSHAANYSALCLFFILLVRNATFSVILMLWTVIMCWTRLYLGQHYLTDILVGIACGVIVGSLCYILYLLVSRKLLNPHNLISNQYTSTGFAKTDIDAVATMFFFVLIYSMIPPVI